MPCILNPKQSLYDTHDVDRSEFSLSATSIHTSPGVSVSRPSQTTPKKLPANHNCCSAIVASSGVSYNRLYLSPRIINTHKQRKKCKNKWGAWPLSSGLRSGHPPFGSVRLFERFTGGGSHTTGLGNALETPWGLFANMGATSVF